MCFIAGGFVTGDNYLPVSLLPALIIADVVVTVDKLIAGVMESMKIRDKANHRCQNTKS